MGSTLLINTKINIYNCRTRQIHERINGVWNTKKKPFYLQPYRNFSNLGFKFVCYNLISYIKTVFTQSRALRYFLTFSHYFSPSLQRIVSLSLSLSLPKFPRTKFMDSFSFDSTIKVLLSDSGIHSSPVQQFDYSSACFHRSDFSRPCIFSY